MANKVLTEEERLEKALVPEGEWPYTLPEGWKWVRLGDVCQFKGGGTPSKSNPNYWNGTIPWASIKDIKGDELWETIDKITNEGVENSSTNICIAGSLIIATRIDPGKTIIAKINTAINQDLKIVQTNLDSRFLHYYFQSIRSLILSKSSGSTVLGINLTNLKGILIPLPAIEIQKQIVTHIESLFSKLDEAKEKVEATLESSELRKSAILHQAFTGELTKKWREENGVKLKNSKLDIPEKDQLPLEEQPYQIPDSWQWTTLGKLTKIVGGGTPSSKVNEYYENGEIPWIRPADLSGYREVYISRGERNITEMGYEKSSAKKMPKDTVLLSSRAPIGYVAIAENELTTNQGFKSFLPSDKFLPKYLYWYLKGNKELLEKNASGTTFLELSATRVGQVEVPVPPLEEQKEISRIMDTIVEKEEPIKDTCINFFDQIELLKKSILSNSFRGEYKG